MARHFSLENRMPKTRLRLDDVKHMTQVQVDELIHDAVKTGRQIVIDITPSVDRRRAPKMVADRNSRRR
jgi:hypothetical protein